jgi:isoleucyl-tRNA synthetase
MKFKKGTRRKLIDYEKDLIIYWKENKIFEKSLDIRSKDNAFVFYDGPPFLTGAPHHGHLLVSVLKDAVARYQTMKGKRVERRWGWDCHGLPAEVFVEKSLGIKNKKEIGTKISVAEYVNACKAVMIKTGTEWEDTIDRIGRWVEFKGAYKTMDKEYMESIWWAFKTLYDKGKVYEGEKILFYCTKDATPISKSEVAMENSYQKDTDPSLYVYFKLEDSDEYLLAWTTTPWTLLANVAIAVNEKLNYSLIEYDNKKIYVATDTTKNVFKDEKHQTLKYKKIKNISGKELVGKRYEPLFENHGPNAHRVLNADFVTTEEGTGIVHEASAYGEEDYELCKANGVPLVLNVDENGNLTSGRWQGSNIWEVNKEIAKTLLKENKAFKLDYILHDYPHCHRCGTKLMYRAHPSWFIDIKDQKSDMLKANKDTNWVPKSIQDGRFNNIIESAPDWNISRDRFWATPIPVWKGQTEEGVEVIKVIGSYEELKNLTGKEIDDYHLQNVIDIDFEIDGVKLRHIGKVLDCWFESGSMPFAQFHYPFENKEKFESSFPADFITEAIDQTRGWFYALIAVNVALFGKAPFKNLICVGLVNAADGKKMSKKLNNYTDPMQLMDKFSADSFRLLTLDSPLTNGEDYSLADKDVGDVNKKLNMIWNMYDFFTLYADIDGWQWDGNFEDPYQDLENPLDQWIVSRVHQLIQLIDDNMQKYDLSKALRPVLPFIDDASNWYVRRSRRRFWKASNDKDKDSAYKTLHYVLVKLAQVLAPFTPFLAEELYRNLTGKESVHLVEWPNFGQINKQLIIEMSFTRDVITQGLNQRATASIKVRQPLSKVTINTDKKLSNEMIDIIKEELNVKSIELKNSGKSIVLDTTITEELKLEGLARELIRQIQESRKNAGLDVADRICLSIKTSKNEIQKAIDTHKDLIFKETLAISDNVQSTTFSAELNVDGSIVDLELQKA